MQRPPSPKPTSIIPSLPTIISRLYQLNELYERVPSVPTANQVVTYVRQQSERVDVDKIRAMLPTVDTTALTRQVMQLMTRFGTHPTLLQYKKERVITKFEANVTASVQLPTMVRFKPAPKITPPAVAVADHNTLTAFFYTAVSLFSRPPAPVKPAYIHEPMETESVADQVERLQSLLPNAKNKAQEDLILGEIIDVSAPFIKQHATTRMDLYFYLLVALYNQQVSVNKVHTDLQHGKGSKKFGSQACHSSLFPHIECQRLETDSTLTNLWNRLFPAKILAFNGTTLRQSQNLTFDLHQLVNKFDSSIEWVFHDNKYFKSRQILACLESMNNVAKGTIDPRQGMNDVLGILNKFFSTYEDRHIARSETPNALRKVFEYQREGTLSIAKPGTETVDDDYIYLLLRMKPDEIAKVKKNPASIRDYYLRMQEEILTPAPVAKPVAKTVEKAEEKPTVKPKNKP